MYICNMIQNPKRRIRKAYWATIVVIISYKRLKFKCWITGRNYSDKVQDLHIQNGIYIKDKILELQGLFIKVGQMISALSNVMPIEFRKPLEELQDKVTPISFDNIKRQFKAEYGEEINEVFEEIDSTPLATASIGQTHLAQLKTGEKVVLKIQHPEIDVIASTDLKIIKKLMNFGAKQMKMQGISESYGEIEKMILDELDYRCEAESIQNFEKRLVNKQVHVPKVYTEFTSQKMLLMSYLSGVKISDLEALDKLNINRTILAKELLELFAEMIFEWGVFHADPHPGNILVNSDGEIMLIDFGAIGEINEEMREGMAELLVSFFEFDAQGISDALKKMGFVISDEEAEKLSHEIVQIGLEFLKNEVEIEGLQFDKIKLKSGKSAIYKLLKKIDVRNLGDTFQIPSEWILLQRTGALVLGICNELDPELNPMDVLKPYLKTFLLGKKSGFKSIISDLVKNQFRSLIQLPMELTKFLKNANSGVSTNESKKTEQILLKSHYSQRAMFFLFAGIAMIIYLLEWTKLELGIIKVALYSINSLLFYVGFINWRRFNKIKS